ncbi:sushi, von Willebrand factor type A, EGF and pentraxin domain-containing protein 1-like [Ptychodera flava]|uniref:sushi, von Willebrand factor type A, EGF and pentraxin domain-containing protein 1-like n=1 Tax=Ptychodera flava TaxID=63121 RepID=UPI003969E837
MVAVEEQHTRYFVLPTLALYHNKMSLTRALCSFLVLNYLSLCRGIERLQNQQQTTFTVPYIDEGTVADIECSDIDFQSDDWQLYSQPEVKVSMATGNQCKPLSVDCADVSRLKCNEDKMANFKNENHFPPITAIKVCRVTCGHVIKVYACDSDGEWIGPRLQCTVRENPDKNIGTLSRPKRAGANIRNLAILLVLAACHIFCRPASQEIVIAKPVIENCPTNITVTSRPLGRSAIVNWETPSAYDSTGAELNLKNGGSSPGSQIIGRSTIHYIAVDKYGNVATCSFTVSVLVSECDRLTPPRNAFLQQSSGFPLLGSSVEYMCYNGYSLHGDRHRRCQNKDGKVNWSGKTPKCIASKCKSLVNPQWGIFSCTSGSQYQSQCTLTCYQGFDVPSGYNRVVLCKENGQWDGGTPYCVDVMPPSFENCPNDVTTLVAEGTTASRVQWENLLVSDNSHDVIKARIIQGKGSDSLFEVGHHVIKYQATDSAANSAYCQFTVRIIESTCPPIKPLSQQRVDCPNGYRAGAICTLGCRYGYKLEGRSTVKCEKEQNTVNGFWDWHGEQPPCTPILCPQLRSPMNGRLLCDLWGHKRLCRVDCDEGYQVPRDYDYPVMQFVCSPAGKWTPNADVPDCIESKEPRSGSLPSELYYYSRNCSDPNFQREVGDLFISKLDMTSLKSSVCEDKVDCYFEDVQIKCEPLRHVSRLIRRFMNLRSNKRGLLPSPLQNVRMVAMDDTYWNLLVIEFNIKAEPPSDDTQTPDVTIGGVLDDTLHQVAKVVEGLVMAGNLTLPIWRGVTTELEKESFTYGNTQISCDQGLLPRSGSYSCASCGTGSYFNATLDTCVRCPVGYYQDKAGRFSCTACPAGTSTTSHGSKNASHCQAMCKAGYYSTNGLEPCSMCDRGFYQSRKGQRSCESCPYDKTTLQMGMTSQVACTGFDLSFSATDAETFPLLTDALSGDIRLIQFSMSFWMQVVNASENTVVIASVHDIRNGTDSALLLFRNPINLEIKTGKYTILTNILLEYRQWHHMMILWDGVIGKWWIYKDGILVTSNFLPPSSDGTSSTHARSAGNDFYLIGRTYSDSVNGMYSSRSVALGGPSFVGDVTNLYIWDMLVTPAEIWQLSGSCGFNADLPPPSVVWSDFVRTVEEEAAVRAPSMCDDINECESSPCAFDSTCIDRIGGFECECKVGLTGRRCEINIDDCLDNACQNGATCVDGIANYTCQCRGGFKGSLCEIQIKDGQWSEWSAWSSCTRTCGHGEKSRWRLCDNPPPDPEGKPCSGDIVSFANCGELECPACKTPRRPLRGFLNCETLNNEEYNCNITCREGYRFSTPVARQYFCGPNTGYRWSHEGPLNPRATFPACQEVEIPDELVVNYQLKYPDVDCGSINEDSDTWQTIDNVVMENVNDIKCVQQSECKLMNVNIGNCRQKRDTDDNNEIVVDIQISKDIKVIPNEDQNKTEIAYQNLLSLKSAIVELENAAATIRNKTFDKSFDVIIDGRIMSVDSNQSEPEGLVTCRSGMVRNQVFCVKCAIGTYYYQGQCQPCPRGHYQAKEGQLVCIPCPDELTTEGGGATNIDECIKITTAAPYLSTIANNNISDSNEKVKNREIFGEIPFLLTFISIPLLILIIVVAIVMCRCWRRQGRLVIWQKKQRKRGDKTLSLRDRVVLKYDPVTGTEKGDTTDEDELDESQL